MVGLPVDLACARCPLAKSRTQVVPGKGPTPSRLVVVGEAPGEREDLAGEPFVGRAGALLDRAMAQAGVAREGVFITNAVKCRPPGNRRPTREEVEACRPFLEGEVAAAGALAVVALGATAARAVLGRPVKVALVGEKPEAAPFAGAPRQVVVTLHPASARFRKGALETIAKALAAGARKAGVDARAPRQERL